LTRARVVLAFTLAASIARAAPSPPPAQMDARTAFDEGERLFARGDYTGALAAFEKVFRIAPHDAVRFNVAVCLERLQRYKDARVQYQAAAESTTLDDADRARARAAAERVAHELGALAATGTNGAALTVEGVVVCTVPCKVELDPGLYHVAADGMPERVVRVERGADLALDVSPPPPPVVAKPERSEARPRGGPTWLTWTGAALGLVGGVGIAYFGLRAKSLHDDYLAHPTSDTRDSGLVARDLANVSIGVVGVGALLVALDLLVLAPSGRAAAKP
jgi:hypothetical protein